MTKILNYGSLNIDYVYDVPHFVKAGETLMSKKRQIFAGGKGLNQSVALARAGGKVYHFGAVGEKDSEILTSVLKENHINSDFLLKRAEASGHTIIQVDESGQNCILLYGGANQSITVEEIDKVLANFEAGDYLVLQNETNNIEYVINKAKEKGLVICFNVSPFNDSIKQLPLKKCDFLIVNEIEGAALVNMDEATDPYCLLEALALEFPDSSFVLTLGSRGSILKLKGQDSISCKSFKVETVDTTAAGDTYLGYLITNLSSGMNPALAIKCATAASALAVQTKGATPSIPKANAVLDFIKKSKANVLVESLE